MNKIVKGLLPTPVIARPSPPPALAHFLKHCQSTYSGENSGAVANYIPELSKANPKHFGISLATIDGHVYEVGDSGVPFTIQSISKAFVFALALERLGAEKVEATIGVEPSGEPFNSIHLNNNNQPFNAMVNAGAIACSGLIYQSRRRRVRTHPRGAEPIRRPQTRRRRASFSERETGDRNRAIAWLLRNYAVVKATSTRCSTSISASARSSSRRATSR